MKYRRITYYLLLGALLIVSSCDFLKMKDIVENPDEEGSMPIARVHNHYLYLHDVEGLVDRSTSPEDSASRVERYVNSWIKKQLLIDEAATKINFNEAEIERKILDYRYSLMGYEYQSYYINQHLNKNIPDDEILEYYEQNLDNFPLKQNIIRGKFIKVPIEAPKINQVQIWIKSVKPEDLENLREYCLKYATMYSLEDSVWLNFDEIIRNTPLAELLNKVDFLKKNQYAEFGDEESLFFLKIDEYKISDNISPLDVVHEQIKNILINKRKVELARNLEEDVYEKAKKNNEFEIYN